MRNAIKPALIAFLILIAGVFVKGNIPQPPTGNWLSAGTMLEPRSSAASARLQDGRILMTGGDNDSGPVASAEFFDTTGAFLSAPQMSMPRSAHSATALADGRILVAGGSTGAAATNAAEIFDPASNAWITIAGGMIQARSNHAASLLADGRVLIAGGVNAGNAVAALEIFDPVSGSFSSVGVMSTPRMSFTSAVLADGRVLLIGGSNGSVPLASTEIFDPSANSVTAGPALSAPRMSHSATTLLDGSVLVAGGNNGSSDVASAEIYDPISANFDAAASSLAAARRDHAAFLLPNNNSVFIVGGTSNTNELATAELYVPSTGSFVATGSPSVARQHPAGSSLGLDGLLLVAGGSNSAGTLATAELYGFATVKTDKVDYAPGEVVTVSGSGWQPGETVTLTLVESPLVDTHPTLTAVADSTGKIVNTDFVPDSHDLNIRFYLTAVGQTSGVHAQNTFTDALNVGKIPSVGAQTPSPVPAGNSATYSVTVSFSGSGGCDALLSATGLPAGTTFSFAPVPSSNPANTITSSGPNVTTTLTVTTTAGTTPIGSSTFVISATGTNGCGSSASTNPTGNGGNATNPTLAVAKANQTVTILTNAPASAVYGSNFIVAATASSGLPVTYTSAGGCTNSGATFTMTSSITACTVNYDQAGNSTYNAAPQLTETVTAQKAALTVSIIGNPTKPYDGNPNATLTSANYSVSGLVGTDSFTVTKTSGTYNSPNVVAASTVTAALSGSDFTPGSGTSLSNYTLPSTATGAGHITTVAVSVSIIGNPTKPYDGNGNATLTPTNFSLAGLVTGESITVTKTGGTYNSATVAAAATVSTTLTAGDFTPGAGTVLTNYVLPTSASGAGHITAVTLGASITGDPTKPYDGNANATLSSANYAFSGLVASESITVTKTSGTYNSPNVVPANTVTATLANGDFTPGVGTTLTNYVLPSTASGAGHITAVTLNGSIVGNPAKPYDGNANATLTSANFSLAGLVTGESIAVTKTSGTYNSPNVVTATMVTATLVNGDFTAGVGTTLTNYVLPGAASGAGHITAVTLNASIVGNPAKPYDGNTNAILTPANFSLAGLVGSESISVNNASGNYNSQNVVGANTVTTSLTAGDFTASAGTMLSNYVFPTSASGAGHITAVTLSASIIGDPTKPYDGNANATLTAANFSLVGLVAGESITVTKTSGTYNSSNVAVADMVTASFAAGDFSSGAATILSNYVLPTTGSGAGHISAVALTGSIIGDPTKPYDGNANAALTPANFSLLGLVAGESLTVTQTSGTYNSANVVTATTVTVTLAAGNFTAGAGTLLSNYILPSTASGAGHITAVTLSASIIGDPTRPYDGNATAVLTPANFSLVGLVTGELISVTETNGTYNSANVATATTVTATLVAGNFTANAGTLLSNYILPSTANGAGHITAVTLSASIIGDPTKPYDGNANATLTPANFSLTGLVAGDSFSVTQTSGLYNSADVLIAATVTANLAAANFSAAGSTVASNYVLPNAASGPGHITPSTLTIHVSAANATYTGLVYAGVTTCSADGVNSEHPLVTLAYQDASHVSLGSAPINAGSYYALCSAGGAGTNYFANSDTASFTINKADPVVTATGNTCTYNASPCSGTGSALGVQNEALAPVTVAYKEGAGTLLASAPVNAGTYSVAARYVGDANYNQKQSSSVAITINKATPLVTANFTPGTVTYDANPHPAVVAVSGVGSIDLSSHGTLSVMYTPGGIAPPANAGSYSASAHFTSSDGNYNDGDSATPASLVIDKATPTISVTGGSFIYDGNTHPATATATGIGGVSVAGSFAFTYTPGNAAIPQNPGPYTVSAAFTSGNVNYANGSNTASITIGYGVCSGSVGPGNVVLPPINSDGTSVYQRKGGSTIPVKFRVCGASGSSISNPAAVFAGNGLGSVTMLSAVRGTVTIVNEADTADIPDAAFRWDASGQQWIFNMATSNLSPGTTYAFRINLTYGSITFQVGVK